MPRPHGTIMHAEVRIGDSRVMMGAPMGDTLALLGSLYLYVNDVDAVYTRALRRRVCQRTSPMGTAALASRPPSATSGGSPRTRKTSRPRRSLGGPRLPVGVPDRESCQTSGRGSRWCLSGVDHWHAPLFFPTALRRLSTHLGHSPACGPRHQIIPI